MNQFYRIYSKEDLMKRIVLLLTAASLLIWPANTFAEPFEGPHPDKHDFSAHGEAPPHPRHWMSDSDAGIERMLRAQEKRERREYIQHKNWVNAEKIGMYEVELSSKILALYKYDQPLQVELGQEYWLPSRIARVETIINSDTCELCFESGDIFYLTGYPTEGFYSGKFIVLTSPILCSRIHSDGTRILRFVPKEELSQRIEDGDVCDKNQIAALRDAGYEKWEYKNGEVFWAFFFSFSRGKINFIDWEGNELTVKPGQLSSASNRLYRQKVREGKL